MQEVSLDLELGGLQAIIAYALWSAAKTVAAVLATKVMSVSFILVLTVAITLMILRCRS